MKNTATQIIGWYGSAALILAYFLVSMKYVDSSGLTYQLLNFTGAIGIVVVALSKKDYPPAMLNIIWSVIGLIALLRLVL